MNKVNINLQDLFLNQVRKEHITITIYLMNGFQLRGNVRGFDNYTIVLDNEGNQQLVYKHAISTIIPIKPINFAFSDITGRRITYPNNCFCNIKSISDFDKLAILFSLGGTRGRFAWTTGNVPVSLPVSSCPKSMSCESVYKVIAL